VKVNVFFDIKVIIDGFFLEKMRTGIYFVAWNTLNVMQKNKNFNITLAYPVEREGSVSLRKIKKHNFFSPFKFVCAGAESKMLVQQRIKIHRLNLSVLELSQKCWYSRG